jgi:tetratricopeptide (TPR) repeat protein
MCHKEDMHRRFAAAGLLLACNNTPDPASADRALPQQRVEPITIAGYTSEELLADFERARAHLLVDRFAQAAQGFDRIMRLTTDPELRAYALFNGGVAHEGMGERAIALERYRELTRAHQAQGIAKNGLVRLMRLYGYLERWDDLGQAADQLLARNELPEMDRIEGYGARALSLVERGQIDKARIAVSKAQELIDRYGFGRSGTPPVQLAQVSFAEGEIRRIQSEKIKLTPVPPNFAEVLEARCQGLLDAQNAFTEAMRSRDAHWSAMSGYRVGQLYQQLHREAMQIPPPAQASLPKKQLFEAAMRLRYRILLEKGLTMMDATVRLGDRTGEDSYWIGRARDAKRQLEQALADEKAALAATPYTEEELRAALEKLKERTKKP